MIATIRPLQENDQTLLEEMLYLALWLPPGQPPFPRDIIKLPELSRYVANWGRLAGDCGFVAETPSSEPLGAVWLRLIPPPGGYGFVNASTPELSMALFPKYRNLGIGSRIMTEILSFSRSRFQTISLSVATANPAVRLYRRFGFEQQEDHGDSLLMILSLQSRDRL